MTSILERLNSGQIHADARKRKPDCVCNRGNIHATPDRARFVNWLYRMKDMYGDDVQSWPEIARKEYATKYVPSH